MTNLQKSPGSIVFWAFFIIAVGLTFVIVESIGDSHGETKSGKVKDAIVLIALTSLLCFSAWCVGTINPLKTAALILAVRILAFDYLVSYLLIKNDVIVGNWYSYTGKTSKFDRLVSGIDWKLRMAIRVFLFGAALWWFLQ